MRISGIKLLKVPMHIVKVSSGAVLIRSSPFYGTQLRRFVVAHPCFSRYADARPDSLQSRLRIIYSPSDFSGEMQDQDTHVYSWQRRAINVARSPSDSRGTQSAIIS